MPSFRVQLSSLWLELCTNLTVKRVIKETPNKWRSVFVKKKLRHAVIQTYVFDRMYMCLSPIVVASVKWLPSLCRSTAFSWVKDSTCVCYPACGLREYRRFWGYNIIWRLTAFWGRILASLLSRKCPSAVCKCQRHRRRSLLEYRHKYSSSA